MKTRLLKLTTLILILVSNIGCRINFSPVQPTPTPPPTPTIAPPALTYLNHALDLIQKYSYYRKNVDWTVIRNAAYHLASRASTPVETYAAINLVFLKLGDRHGGLTKPYIPGGMLTPSPFFEHSVGKLLEGHVGYILVPGADISDMVADEYVASIQGDIQKIDQFHPCGWIVDLRENPGGAYSLMAAGTAPILGEGRISGSIDADGKITYVTYQGGIYRFGNEIEFVVGSPYHLVEPTSPVAVLTDGGTDSAAEALTIAFRGRPNTRSFGQPTGGHNPGVIKLISLEDGEVLWITTQLIIDLTGKIYPQAPIQPDEVAPLPDDKSVPQVAIDWLLSQPACSIPYGITPSP